VAKRQLASVLVAIGPSRVDDERQWSENMRSYQKGIKVSKTEMKCLDIPGDQFHSEWNYTISRASTRSRNRSSYCLVWNERAKLPGL
jgi:hypothetical protein